MKREQGMSDDAKSMLTPKLRFAEFRDGPSWQEKALDVCLDYEQPTPYLVSSASYSDAFKTPVLTAGKTFILGYTNEESGIFSEGLPVIIFDDFTTATQFVDFPFKAKSSAMKILRAKGRASIKFMYERLQTLSYEVGAHERHWISKFARMLVAVPEPAEQQKIAECLSTLDERIGAESQKLDALKAHKKGLMQQLFPREGETLPRLRFPEFQDAPEWAEKPLGEVCEILNNRRKPITSSERTTGPYPYYGASGIVDYVDSFIFEEPLLLVGEDGAKWGAFERTAFVVRGRYWVNNHAHVLRGIAVGNDFLENYLAKIDLTPFVTGAAPPKLTLGKLKEIPIPVPSSKDEEQRIASCLSSLDDLIAAQSDQLEALKNHKKGLMQQLFPAPAEAAA